MCLKGHGRTRYSAASSRIDPGGQRVVTTPSAWPCRGEELQQKKTWKEGKGYSCLVARADRPEERACLRHFDELVEFSAYCPADRRTR